MTSLPLIAKLKRITDGDCVRYVGITRKGQPVEVVPDGEQLRLHVGLKLDGVSPSKISDSEIMGRRPPRKMTAAEIDSYRTAKGGFSRESFRRMGIGYPPPRGWRQALLRGEPMPTRERLGAENSARLQTNAAENEGAASPSAENSAFGNIADIPSLYVSPIIDRATGRVVTGPEAETSPLRLRDEIERLANRTHVSVSPAAGFSFPEGASVDPDGSIDLSEPRLAVLMSERAA